MINFTMGGNQRKSIRKIIAVIAVIIMAFGIALFPLLLPVNYSDQIVILTYHRVSDSMTNYWDSQITVTPNQFENHLKYYQDNGFNVLSLDQALSILEDKQKPIPPKAIVITFDDAEISYSENAVPILDSFDFSSSVFVIGKFSQDGKKDYMTWPQIKSLTANRLVNIHSHTYNTHSNDLVNGQYNYATDPLYLNKEKRFETSQEYSKRINDDLLAEQKLFLEYLGRKDNILVLPYGHGTSEYIQMAQNNGYQYFLTQDTLQANSHDFDPSHVYRLDVGNTLTDTGRLSFLIKGHTSSGPLHLIYLAKIKLSALYHQL